MAETGNMNAIMTAQTGVQRAGEGVHGLKRMTKMTSQTQKKGGLNNNSQAQTKEARTLNRESETDSMDSQARACFEAGPGGAYPPGSGL